MPQITAGPVNSDPLRSPGALSHAEPSCGQCLRQINSNSAPFFVSADLWFIDLFSFYLHFTLTDHEQLTSGGLAQHIRTTIRSQSRDIQNVTIVTTGFLIANHPLTFGTVLAVYM